MSSWNFIYYDWNDNENPYKKDITSLIREKVSDIITYNRDYYSNAWLNLILKDVPNEISSPNAHLFYLFFNNNYLIWHKWDWVFYICYYLIPISWQLVIW